MWTSENKPKQTYIILQTWRFSLFIGQSEKIILVNILSFYMCESHHFTVLFKGPYADHILIPQGSTGSSIFLISNEMKAHIFLIANPKFQLQILCSFGDITKSMKLNGIPENNFLCIFIIASSQGVHTFFCLWRVNKKLPRDETSQNAFQRSRSIN